MKKTILLIIIAMILLVNSVTAYTIIYSQSFETNSTYWTKLGRSTHQTGVDGIMERSTTQAHTGAYSMRVKRDNTNNVVASLSFSDAGITFNSDNIYNITFWVYYNSAGQSLTALMSNTCSYGQEYNISNFWVYHYVSGSVKEQQGSVNNNYVAIDTSNNGAWNKYEFVIDYTNNVYDLKINNVLVSDNLVLPKADLPLFFDVGADSINGEIFLDDLVISSEGYNNFRITNTNSVSVFNATVNGTFYSTTNGTINIALENSGVIVPIIVRASNYFNYNQNTNLTNDLSVTFLEHPIITLYDLWDNSSIDTFGAFVSGGNSVCRQDAPNETSVCGNSDVSYLVNNSDVLYFNYSIPVNALSNSKVGIDFTEDTLWGYGFTDCWDDERVVFRWEHIGVKGNLTCYNPTTKLWKQIFYFIALNPNDIKYNKIWVDWNLTGTVTNTSNGELHFGYNESKTLSLYNSNYFIKTLTHNFTDQNDLNTSMFQSVINFNITETFTGKPITNFILKNGSIIILNTTGSFGTIYLPKGAYNNFTITDNDNIFLTKTLNGFTINTFDNRTFNYSFSPSYINITATKKMGGGSISNFSVNFTSLNHSHSVVSSTTNGSIIFNGIDGDIYNITISDANYANYGNSVLKVMNSSGYYSFSVYTTNSVQLYFKYENNETLMSDNITTEIIGSINSYNSSTTNGTIYLDLLSPNSYIIRNNAPGFLENFYYFTLTNRSFNNITIYMSSNITNTLITGVVIDEVNNYLEGAIIKVLKYYSSDNTYKLVGSGQTNFDGETMLSIETGSEFYKFLIYYPNNNLRKETEPTYIFEDTETITFQIVIGETIASNFFNAFHTDYSLTFNNNTNNFRFTFSDTDGYSSQYCLKIYQLKSLANDLINSSCLSSSTGTILLGITPVNGSTYVGKAYAYYSSRETFIDSITVFFDISNKDNLLLYLVMLLTIVFALSSVWSIQTFLFLTPLPLFISSLVGLIPISPVVIGGIYAFFIIIAFTINK